MAPLPSLVFFSGCLTAVLGFPELLPGAVLPAVFLAADPSSLEVCELKLESEPEEETFLESLLLAAAFVLAAACFWPAGCVLRCVTFTAAFSGCFSWAISSSELEDSSELPELDADALSVLLAAFALGIGVEVAGCACRFHLLGPGSGSGCVYTSWLDGGVAL